MPTGSPRPTAGPPLGSRNNPHGRRGKPKAPVQAPPADVVPSVRPKFESGREFALWVLNADDHETPMEVKVRAMQALVMLEGKAPAEPAKKTAPEDEAGGLYAPRKVRGFGVVNGGR